MTNYRKLVASGELDDITSYDFVVVSFSGGKDSVACVLALLDLGVKKSQLELWHQRIDGDSEQGLMDWPCTDSYVKAFAKALGLSLYFQWRSGGLEREMLRENERTQGVYFEDEGGLRYLPTTTGKESTRRLFPQVSADLSVRWCSAYGKIMCAQRAMTNSRRFVGKKSLFVTGERRQESSARANYKEIEKHRCDSRERRVTHWRAVIDWVEHDVWETIERHRIIAHPAYYLGFGRVSCMTCIFADKHQWATIREMDPDRFNKMHQYEVEFGKTIQRKQSIVEQADAGIPYDLSDKEMLKLGLSRDYPVDRIIMPDDQEWRLPAGAFKHCGGPT